MGNDICLPWLNGNSSKPLMWEDMSDNEDEATKGRDGINLLHENNTDSIRKTLSHLDTGIQVLKLKQDDFAQKAKQYRNVAVNCSRQQLKRAIAHLRLSKLCERKIDHLVQIEHQMEALKLEIESQAVISTAVSILKRHSQVLVNILNSIEKIDVEDVLDTLVDNVQRINETSESVEQHSSVMAEMMTGSQFDDATLEEELKQLMEIDQKNESNYTLPIPTLSTKLSTSDSLFIVAEETQPRTNGDKRQKIKKKA